MKEWERRQNIWGTYSNAVEKLLAQKDAEIERIRGLVQENGGNPPQPTSGDSLSAATATPNGTPTF